jgi:hypothetical protein
MVIRIRIMGTVRTRVTGEGRGKDAGAQYSEYEVNYGGIIWGDGNGKDAGAQYSEYEVNYEGTIYG